MKFLEQLNEKMKLDSIAAEVGFDMNVNAILARVEQLVKLEGDAVIESKTVTYSLRRKVSKKYYYFLFSRQYTLMAVFAWWLAGGKRLKLQKCTGNVKEVHYIKRR